MAHALVEQINQPGWLGLQSHVDWWAELRIKQNETPAANGALERVGVEIKLMKAEGAPTKHYRLDVKRFLAVVASTLSLTLKKLAALLKMHLPNGANGFEEWVKIHNNKAINDSSTNNAAVFDPAVQSPESSWYQRIHRSTARDPIRC